RPWLRPPAATLVGSCQRYVMPRAALGNALQDFARELVITGVHGQVTERDNPHELLVAVEHQQPADLPVLHELGCLFDIVVRQAMHDPAGHDITSGTGPGVAGLGYPSDHDIAVRHHSRQAVIFADRQTARIQLAHLRGRLLKRRFGSNAFDATGHNFSDLHDRPPWHKALPAEADAGV